MEKIAAVILAAGKGKRMGSVDGSEIPKVMFRANGKPIVQYLIKSINNAGINNVILVVGYKKEVVKDYFKDEVEYAVQEEQLGTGHATMMAQPNLDGKTEAVIVCYGDMPLYKPETIKNLIIEYQAQEPTIAMLSVKFNDPEFWAYGRIIRDKEGFVEAIVEQKDCNPEQLKIKESNPGFYIFNSKWLWQNLKKLSTDNAQHEYYLTDMIKIARDQGKKIIAVPVSDESEVLGINTPEQLKKVEEILLGYNNR
jgi:UDP-N-acetylglucosamine diphosphorylase/glucosamine-1-phosphate N-acetyltransferase